jgi:hypothetical protein
MIFSEMTFYPEAGFALFNKNYELLVGEYLTINEVDMKN